MTSASSDSPIPTSVSLLRALFSAARIKTNEPSWAGLKRFGLAPLILAAFTIPLPLAAAFELLKQIPWYQSRSEIIVGAAWLRALIPWWFDAIPWLGWAILPAIVAVVAAYASPTWSQKTPKAILWTASIGVGVVALPAAATVASAVILGLGLLLLRIGWFAFQAGYMGQRDLVDAAITSSSPHPSNPAEASSLPPSQPIETAGGGDHHADRDSFGKSDG